ncbi:MAG: PLP-dependent aminotransferase family protein, partial [Rhizobiales bacterium]|nr:PLP-dependent aminotransferase family protein [Hyphomicrobiales bacterium]
MDILFTPLSKSSTLTLSDQLCEKISSQISTGLLKPGQRLPSCRKIAMQLNISRNTVVSAYHNLIYDGLVEARERSGYFVHNLAKAHCATLKNVKQPVKQTSELFNILSPNKYLEYFNSIQRPKNWADYPYPFVCNQMDAKRFPLQNWRKVCADILSQNKATQVISDHSYDDCEELITEIQTRLLPNRGIFADKSQILLTAGAQQAIYLTAMIFGNPNRIVSIEDPCYPEARNIFSLFFDNINHIKLDDEGIICNQTLKTSNMVYVTPNHQYPTTLKMSEARRETLLALAKQENIIIIEDDYDSSTDFNPNSTPSLKANDTENNVIYIGSLSKNLNPGLRIGYLVASPDFI